LNPIAPGDRGCVVRSPWIPLMKRRTHPACLPCAAIWLLGCVSNWASLSPRSDRDATTADRVLADIAGPLDGADAPIASGDAADAPSDAPRNYAQYAAQWSTAAPFVDACGMPGAIQVVADADDAVVPELMPFAFTFYAITGNQVWVSSNGFVAFSNPTQYTYTHGCEPQDCNAWSNAAFGYFNDLVTRDRGVCVAVAGSAPSRRFVMTWSDATELLIPHDGGDRYVDANTHLTFSILLHEGTDQIEMLFGTMAGELSTGQAFTGLRSPLCIHTTEFACHPGAIAAGSRVVYTPQP
jgi:hypothetical protein